MLLEIRDYCQAKPLTRFRSRIQIQLEWAICSLKCASLSSRHYLSKYKSKIYWFLVSLFLFALRYSMVVKENNFCLPSPFDWLLYFGRAKKRKLSARTFLCDNLNQNNNKHITYVKKVNPRESQQNWPIESSTTTTTRKNVNTHRVVLLHSNRFAVRILFWLFNRLF